MRWHFNSLLTLVLVCFFCSILVRAQSDDDWDWLTRNFHSVLDTTLPLEKDCHSCIAYRSYETLQVGELEYSMLITWKSFQIKKGLTAHIRMPDTVPLGSQLMTMHRNQRNRSVLTMVSDLKFKDWRLTEAECPAIKSQYEKLQALRLNLVSETITMDPRVHEFHIDSYSGTADLTILEEENLLVKWGVETRHLLDACGAGQEPVPR